MKYIEIKQLPDKAALKAYKNGNYVEAIQILHAWIENQAQQLVMLIGSVHFGADSSITWDITDTFKLHECLKFLLIMNHITKSEFDKFLELNSMRNKIIHQIYKESYKDGRRLIPKSQFDKVFKESLKQTYFFTNKSAEIIEVPTKYNCAK